MSLAYEKHKTMKDCLRSRNENTDTEKLHLCFKDFIDHLNDNLGEAFSITVKYLYEYYEHRSSQCKPRFAVKTIFNERVFDLFRDRGQITWPPFPVEKNTAFASILENGTYFLCNDIPTSTKQDSYHNMRLNRDCASHYKPSRRFKIFPHGPCRDPNWEKCWDTEKKERPVPETCYKSTLVIPIALINTSTTAEFRQAFNIGASTERSVFGFLCFDHVNTDFFNQGTDIDIGYVFADMLSLYIITRMILMSHSITFKEVENILERAGKINAKVTD
jgi:hypothetical protein